MGQDRPDAALGIILPRATSTARQGFRPIPGVEVGGGFFTLGGSLMATDWTAIWTNVLSGSIGGVFGAGVTVWATRATTKGMLKANLELVNEQDIRQRDTIWRGLLTEIRENNQLASSTITGGWQNKVMLLTYFWDQAATILHELPEQTRNDLTETYSTIHKHNELALYDRYALDVGQGTVTQPITEFRKTLGPKLYKLETDLKVFVDGRR
jgi:hypothetical protein